MALKPGWLNRQFDQVTKDVEAWPEWMKRAAGFREDSHESSSSTSVKGGEERVEAAGGTQRTLNLK